mmetsp:Transcript_21380/g.34751  ORF Transcript_21380/g.34751 Transcript_21380/m.34751 type:complete len:214 (+) Transcript_21380:431-1072(+)
MANFACFFLFNAAICCTSVLTSFSSSKTRFASSLAAIASASTRAASCSALACSSLALAILAFFLAAASSRSWILRSFLAEVSCCFCFFLSFFIERRSCRSSFSSSFFMSAFNMAASRLAAAAACFSFNSFIAISSLAFPIAFLSKTAVISATPEACDIDKLTLATMARVDACDLRDAVDLAVHPDGESLATFSFLLSLSSFRCESLSSLTVAT